MLVNWGPGFNPTTGETFFCRNSDFIVSDIKVCKSVSKIFIVLKRDNTKTYPSF